MLYHGQLYKAYWQPMLLDIFLVALSIESAPLHNYQYEYTATYGVREFADGTQFYTPSRPTMAASILVLWSERTTSVVSFDTGFRSPKYTRRPSFSVELEHRIPVDEQSTISLFLGMRYEGKITHRPCFDDLGRTFHCYHGVVNDSPLYALSFDTIAAHLSQRQSGLRRIGLAYEYRF